MSIRSFVRQQMARISAPPLRVRLALWMITIFLVAQLVASLVLQVYQSREIERFLNQRMVAAADSVGDTTELAWPNVPQRDLLTAAARLGPDLSDVSLDVYSREGAAIASTRQNPPPLEAGALESARERSSTFSLDVPEPTAYAGQAPLRRAIRPIRGSDGRPYILVVTAREPNATQLVDLPQRTTALNVPLTLIPIAICAYLVAGLALRPLAEIRRLARSLSPESIAKSIESSSGIAEVSAVRYELEQARRRIEAGFAAQERFMANVSHELKTPIATVLTELQALKRSNQSGQTSDFLRSMTEELENLGKTVDNFLLLTRIRHGKAQLRSSGTCLVRDLMLEPYASCSTMAEQHGVRLELQVPDGENEDVTVNGNCDLLRIVFENLIRNAIRFSPAEGVVHITAQVRHGNVEIAVRDEGPGIPVELLPRIFDRFSQAKDEERRGRGHGLGLEIALGIAELHSGTITVRNCADRGCQFTVVLPLSRNDSDAATGPFVLVS